MSKDLVNILLGILIVIGFYFFIGDSGEDTGYMEIKVKAVASVFLIIFILFVSTDWWAITISLIELTLAILSFSVMKTWDIYDPLDAAYPQIQQYAFVVELIILCTAFWSGWGRYVGSRHSRGGIPDSRRSIKNQRGFI